LKRTFVVTLQHFLNHWQPGDDLLSVNRDVVQRQDRVATASP